ncbi:RIP metalloprotease RseP [soil metagenome]
MTSILAFVFVLGVLIFVHELGHFLMARRIGVRVHTFSLGFGPKLLSFKRGDTEYCVSAIPLGGYVKMAGENPEESRTGSPDEFLSKTKWQRFQVLIMGPVMNLVLAVLVMAVVLYQGAPVPAYEAQPVEIGGVVEGSVAEASGILPGDRVIRVNGNDVPTWERFSMEIVPRANREVTLLIERDGRAEERRLVPAAFGKYEMGDIGVLPRIRPQIVSVNPGLPAAEAGVQADDVVVGVDGRQGLGYEEVLDRIKASEGRAMTFELERAGQPVSVTVTPRPVDGIPRIGATINAFEVLTIEPGPFEALQLSVQRNWEWSVMIVDTLRGLFTRDTSVKQLMGPVAIADLSGTAASQGWIPLFSLMAMISLNLGLLNLMPIPVLDGGHITILALEGVSRRDFSIKVKEKMLMAGFVLLLTLMVTVIYNDLTRIAWIERLMPWR